MYEDESISNIDMPLINKHISAYDKHKKKRKSTVKSTGKSPKNKDSLSKTKSKSKSRSKSQNKKKGTKKVPSPTLLSSDNNKLIKTKISKNKSAKKQTNKTAKSKHTDKLNVKTKQNVKKPKKKTSDPKNKRDKSKKASKGKKGELKLNVERVDSDSQQLDQSPIKITRKRDKESEENENDEVFTNQSSSTQKNNKPIYFMRNKKSNTSLQVRKSINEGESIEIALASRRSSVRKDTVSFNINGLNKNKSEDKLPFSNNKYLAQNNIISYQPNEPDYDSVPSPTFITPENNNKDLRFEIINIESQISGINNSDVYVGGRGMVNSPEFNNGIQEAEEEEDNPNFDSFKSKEKKIEKDDSHSHSLNLSGVRKKDQLIFVNQMRDEESEDSNVFGVKQDTNESNTKIDSPSHTDKVGTFSIPYDSNKDNLTVPKQNTIKFN